MVKVINSETQEVIREIPREDIGMVAKMELSLIVDRHLEIKTEEPRKARVRI